MEDNEPHAVVRLLLKRMESHPEEFRGKEGPYHDRWYNHISAINTYGNEADKAALAEKVRDIRMGVIHEQVMDELLNGEDRRRKEEEETEYERHLAASLQYMKQQQARQLLTEQQARLNTYGQYNQASGTALLGRSPISTLGTLTASQIEPTLSSSTINQIKKALGIKK